jgi:hypothetical protein
MSKHRKSNLINAMPTPDVTKAQEYTISAEALDVIRVQQRLIQDQQFIAQALRDAMSATIQKATGQDVTEGDWEVDVDAGVLRRG